MILLSLLFIAQLAFPTQLALGDAVLRPQSVAELGENVSTERGFKVEDAEVVWINYEAIRKDFRGIAHFSDLEIKSWVLEQFTYIGVQQPRFNGIRNSPIKLNKKRTKKIYRSSESFRSGTVEARHPSGELMGLIDIKGLGHGLISEERVDEMVAKYNEVMQIEDPLEREKALTTIMVSDHSDGLMSLGEAIAELTRQKAVQLAAEARGIAVETFETYAIIRLPFNILKSARGHFESAALYLRQANVGRFHGLVAPSNLFVDEAGGRQMTKLPNTAIDFGGVIITDAQLASMFSAENGSLDPLHTRAWRWAQDTAQAITRSENPDKNAIYNHLEDMLRPLEETLKISTNAKAIQERRRERHGDLRRKVEEARGAGLSFEEIIPKILVWQRDEALNLLEVGALDADYSVRISVGEQLKNLPEEFTLPIVRTLLNDKDFRVRKAAVNSLMNRQSPEALQLLETAAYDKIKDVRNKAMTYLKRLKKLKSGSSRLRCVLDQLG